MTGAHVVAVAAWELPSAIEWAAWPQDWNPGRDALKSLTSTVDDVFDTDRPQDMQLVAREGGAARVLLEESRGALMLVVGSRGLGGFVGLLQGSVSANVANAHPVRCWSSIAR